MSRLIATCRPLLSLSLLTLIGVSALTGCRPELDEDTGVRLGIVGEFCQADASCREDLVCNNSQCVDLNGGDPSTCATMCDRLVNVCGRDEPNAWSAAMRSSRALAPPPRWARTTPLWRACARAATSSRARAPRPTPQTLRSPGPTLRHALPPT